MSWWWAGAIGAVRQQQDERAGAAEQSFQGVALVVGSTGIVGTSLVDILSLPDTPGGPWKIYALSRRPLPPWYPTPTSTVTHLHVDLADSAAVAEALTPLTDITHVFYVALAMHFTEAQNREANSAMLRNVLSVVVPNCPALVHVCLQTGSRHYTGPPEVMLAGIPGQDPPFSEDMPRLDYPNFYYDQEDILFDEVSRRDGAVSWSVHRPTLIFGFSPRSAMNIVCSLCVYAAICRKEGIKLRWPGSRGAWEGFSNASDADLIAEQQIWAALDPSAKNEAFNCSNGDIYKWKQLWPVLAEQFGLEWAGYEGEESRFKLVETMEGGGVDGDCQGERARGDTALRGRQLVVRRWHVLGQLGVAGHHEQEQGAWVPRLPEHGEVLQYMDRQDEASQDCSLMRLILAVVCRFHHATSHYHARLWSFS